MDMGGRAAGRVACADRPDAGGSERPEQVVAPAEEPVREEASEVVLTPEVLDEPIPGMGWTPSMEPSTEEGFEEEFPVITEEPLPYVAPEAELSETLAEAVVAEPLEEEEPAPPVQYFAPAYAEEVEAPMDTVRSAATPSEETFGPAPSAAPTSVDDLKARIEETRRRIRRELEQPFLSLGDQGPVTAEADSHSEADASRRSSLVRRSRTRRRSWQIRCRI